MICPGVKAPKNVTPVLSVAGDVQPALIAAMALRYDPGWLMMVPPISPARESPGGGGGGGGGTVTVRAGGVNRLYHT
jgi:hypothetical protein